MCVFWLKFYFNVILDTLYFINVGMCPSGSALASCPRLNTGTEGTVLVSDDG